MMYGLQGQSRKAVLVIGLVFLWLAFSPFPMHSSGVSNIHENGHHNAASLSSISPNVDTNNSTHILMSSYIWDGYEFYDSYSGVYDLNPITASTATINVASFSEPPSNEIFSSQAYVNGYCVNIHREVAVWIGLSENSGGGGGLIQTGYMWNDQNDTYSLVWELYPTNNVQYYKDQGEYPIHAGDIINFALTYSNGYWAFNAYDYTNGHSYPTASIESTENAYFSQFIVEAPTLTYSSYGINVVQQIPEFSSAINFEGAAIYGYGSSGDYQYIPISSLYNHSWVDQYYLQQDSNEPNNINHSFIMQTGTYFTNEFGYTQEEWANSHYNIYSACPPPPPPPGGGCVLNGALISVSRGHSVPVQDLKVGDKILTYNLSDGKLVKAIITRINSTNVSSILDINNGLLYVSGLDDQPIYAKLANGSMQWIMVGSLNTNDSIFDPLNGTWIHVFSIRSESGNYTVYDLSSSITYSNGGYERSDYIANGILLDVKCGPNCLP